MINNLELNDGTFLNGRLVTKMELSLEQIQRLKELHREKDIVMQDAHEQIKQIEFEMQRVWGFAEDDRLHTHRFRVPCPEIKELDNE